MEQFFQTIQNPDASSGLVLTLKLVSNASDDRINRNIEINSRKPLPWLHFCDEHDGVAVLVGGGPSLKRSIPFIRELSEAGARVYAMNGASRYLGLNGIRSIQMMVDARPENIDLLDTGAIAHYLASQVDPSVVDIADTDGFGHGNVILMHLMTEDIESHLPKDRVKQGGYALLGGGYGVGNTGLCAAYVMGYREIHCFGYDSSHAGQNGHAYRQSLNDDMQCVETTWAGKTYWSTVAMKAHAVRFQVLANDLKTMGCDIHVHGDGLLPAMFNTPSEKLSEKDKYFLMWQFPEYRDNSPGEKIVGFFLELVKPDGKIIDFGCGTGRACLVMIYEGHEVLGIDFAGNCRDIEAENIPFLEWDLTQPMPVSAPYGYCTDVLEHIPPKEVDNVLRNIMDSAGEVFFQISTAPDVFGSVIGTELHLSIHDHDWWREKFIDLGYSVEWEQDREAASCYLITRGQTHEH